MHQWRRIESPVITHISMGNLYENEGKNIQWTKDSLFKKWSWENWTATCEKNENTLPNTIQRINLKWIKDLNMKAETTKLLEQNISRALSDINHSKILIDPSPRVMKRKTKINKLLNKLLIKLKSFWRTGWRRRRWTWSTSLSTYTSGIHLQTQKCMQNACWEWIGLPNQWKRIYTATQNSVGWRNYGKKTGVLVGLDLPLKGGGTEAGVWSPHRGNCLSQRRNV